MAGNSVAALCADLRAPHRIEQLARAHALGALLGVRSPTLRLFATLVHFAGALLSVAAYLLLWRLARGWEGTMPWQLEVTIGVAKLGLIVFGAFLVQLGVLTLARGRRALYLWEGGFIQHDGRIRAYSWADLEELLAVRHHTGDEVGEIYRYRLVPRNGPPITVPIRPVDGRDPFAEALVEAMQAAGRPVG